MSVCAGGIVFGGGVAGFADVEERRRFSVFLGIEEIGTEQCVNIGHLDEG